MAEFTDFKSLGELFQTSAFVHSGKAAVARGFSGFVASSKAGVALESGLHKTGKEMVKFFKHKVRTGGGDNPWLPLSESTERQREAVGYTPDDPLYASHAIYHDLGYEVVGLDVKIGFDKDDHAPLDGDNQYQKTIPYDDLIGYTDFYPGLRPIFNAPDFEAKAQAVAMKFGKDAIRNGWLRNLSKRA